MSSGLWIILLEAGAALALLLVLVCWTLPKKPRNSMEKHDAREGGSPPG